QRHDVLLGPYGTNASRQEYARVIAEWEAAGRRWVVAKASDITVNELIGIFWPHVEKHYRRPDGTPTKEVLDFKMSLRPLAHLDGETVAKELGPTALKAVRQLMISGYDHPNHRAQPSLARGVVNQRVGRIRRMFRWAVENELVPAAVYSGL